MAGPIQNVSQAIADIGQSSTSAGAEQNADFSITLESAMNQIGQIQSNAQDQVAELLNGNGQDVHSAMIAVEKANLAFDMMVEVRNKIVQAYQQISQMQF
jgi:flagellar hook-basal body complex protein FliE